MRIINKDLRIIHAFFKIKKIHHHIQHQAIINDFQSQPGLYYLSHKYNIDVERVYEILRTHDINELNMNVINIIEKQKWI